MEHKKKSLYNLYMSRIIKEKTAIDCLNDWLDSYLNFEKNSKKGIFWLETIKFLCNRFNNPQNSFSSVHVAGSKGKGSVSTMLSSIIKEYKGSCGLYTSPHILSLAERITNAHDFLDEKIYEEAVRELVSRTESIIPEQLPNEREITWFELVTIFAFLCFRKSKFSWTVFETGLGGRLDSTNILMPNLSVITPIELEHTEFLGDTIEKISEEKAGIIKPNTPVVVSKQSQKALDVIKNKTLETNSKLYYIEDYVSDISYKLPKLSDVNFEKTMKVSISYKELFSRPIKANLQLIGKIQAENASVAALCAKILFPEIPEEIIEVGLEKANLSGRFEITSNPLNKKQMVIYDGAHTVKSIIGTLDSLKFIFSKDDSKKGILIFGSAADKNIEHIAKELINCNLFSKIYITKPGLLKQSDLSRMIKAFENQLANKDITLEFDENFENIFYRAVNEGNKKCVPILITGSFYLIAEGKKVFSAIESNNSSET